MRIAGLPEVANNLNCVRQKPEVNRLLSLFVFWALACLALQPVCLAPERGF